MKLIIREVERHGIYDVFVGAEKLCRSRTPLLAAARKLILQGVPGACPLEMWREGTNAPAITTTVGVAANLSVVEREGSPPSFERFRAFPDAPAGQDEAAE